MRFDHIDQGGKSQFGGTRPCLDIRHRGAQRVDSKVGAGQASPINEGAAAQLASGQVLLEQPIERGHDRGVGPRTVEARRDLTHAEHRLTLPQTLHDDRLQPPERDRARTGCLDGEGGGNSRVHAGQNNPR